MVPTAFMILASAALVWTMPEGCGLGDAHSGAQTIVGMQGMAFSIIGGCYLVVWAIRERKVLARALRDLFNAS